MHAVNIAADANAARAVRRRNKWGWEIMAGDVWNARGVMIDSKAVGEIPFLRRIDD